MKTRNEKMNVRVLAFAVQAALVAMYAMPVHADDAQAAALKAPASFGEIGALNVSRDSAKFGEYTGLNKSGVYLIGNFGMRGGDAYGDGNGTRRWEVWGNDLGLTSRSVGGSIADQGRWNLGLSFDQLTHYTSDSYQTPYSGSMGGNSFTLPSFGLAANTRTLSAAQLAQFQTMKISNDRDNTSITGGLIFDRQWSIKADFNHLEQSGAKLMGFGSAQFAVAGAPNGERIAILPMPTNYRTDTANLALNWLGEKGHATASYFGSYFRDKYNGVSFDTFAGATVTETMGTAPSNDLHQLNLSGGYAFSKRTKIAGGLSYSHNTQNTAYAYDTAAMVTASPTSSLNGSVRNTHADVKLTDQTTRDLTLSGGLKYDYRNNHTSSNIYNFRSIDGGNIANYPNAPISIRKSQVELAGDYRLSTAQKVRLAWNHEDTQRKCNQYAVGGGTPAYEPGTNCITVPRTKEDKLSAAYRLKAAEGLNLNAGYSYSDRRSDRDLNARPPMIGRDGNATAAGIAAAPPGITGLNAGEFIGFNPFFEASRKQNMLKAGANWQVIEPLSLGFSGRFTDDNYGTTFGMQKGRSWALNLDGTYVYREEGSITAYVTQQERSRYMNNEARSPLSAPTATVPSGATWNNRLKDTDTTIGLNAKQGGLMGGKLTLLGDMTYSLTRTSFNTTLNYNLLSGPPCSDPSIYTCVPLPDITSRLFQFKLSSLYQATKSSKFTLGYLYQRLRSDDFYYNGLQNGFTPTSVLPTNQTAPNYSINMVFASYIYNF
jgi:MtrB/PioB family decaheme-associated outer membrane protein